MKLASFQQRIQELKNAPPSKVRSQRGELIGMFLEKLNVDRKPPFKPLTPARVGMMLSPIKSVADLRAFYGECSASSHFGKYFFWRYKIAKQ